MKGKRGGGVGVDEDEEDVTDKIIAGEWNKKEAGCLSTS